MKLLYTTTSHITLSTFLAQIAVALKARGMSFDAASSDIHQCTICEESFDNLFEVRWSRSVVGNTNFLASARNMKSIVLENRYDVVHTHTPIAAFITRFALKDLPDDLRPVVIYTAHGFHFHSAGPLLFNLIYRFTEKLAARWTDHMIVINREDETAARLFKTIPFNNVHYIAGIGVDLEHYCKNAVLDESVASLLEALELNEESVLFACIAEFTANKRHIDQLQALVNVENDQVHLAFAGVGGLMLEIKQKVAELGLQSRVHFLGHLEDVRPLILASRAVLLSSDREGLPRSLMEAMSLERAVIGPFIRGVSDLVSVENGLTFPPRDVDALANALSTLAADKNMATELGVAGREKLKPHSFDAVVDAHAKLYFSSVGLG